MKKFLYLFFITLAVSGCKKESTLIEDYAPDEIRADFDVVIGKFGSCSFINKSVNATDYIWIFDDGSTSTEKSPIYNFNTKGTYKVKLIARNGEKSAYTLKSVNILTDKPSKIRIKKVTLLEYYNAPFDNGGYADVYFEFNFNNNVTIFHSRNQPINDLPYNQAYTWNTENSMVLDIINQFEVYFYDWDPTGYALIDYLPFNPPEYIRPNGTYEAYPDEISFIKSRQGDGNFAFKLTLEWIK